MTVTFFSNYLNHHQIPFSNEMYKLLGDGYCFVQTQPIAEERIKLGWQDNINVPYLLKSYNDEVCFEKALALGRLSDVVIIGSAPSFFIKNRKHKLTFFYSERIFKKGFHKILNPFIFKNVFLNYTLKGLHKNKYLLCASAYALYDFKRIKAFSKKMFKWGYFPEKKEYNLKELFKAKENQVITILWVGRFLDWKHPEYALQLAEKLKQKKIHFQLNIIGTGPEEQKLKLMYVDSNLSEEVKFLGAMSPNMVRTYMEKSNIFIFTSDFNEGWGAVLNEAMNSGCAIVASHAIGAVPYLIENGENGYIYKNGDFKDFYMKVKKLIEQPELMKLFGKKAMETINNLWNSKIAAERLITLSHSILDSKKYDIYDTGPCSKAPIIRNNWYK